MSWQVLKWEIEPPLSAVSGYPNWGPAHFFSSKGQIVDLGLSRTYGLQESSEAARTESSGCVRLCAGGPRALSCQPLRVFSTDSLQRTYLELGVPVLFGHDFQIKLLLG